MKIVRLLIILVFFFSIQSIQSQGNFDKVTIETIKLTDNTYMLVGRGGNIGVSVGDDGVFVIDSQFAPLTPKILKAIKGISDKEIKFLANTHHHGDHSGGNENISKLGTHIIAHDNVYARIKANSRQTDDALPIITFNDKLSIYINGEQVLVFHVDNAHTDGDAMLYFTESNVLHTGDTYFNGRYPYIDLNSGGSASGYIDAVKAGMMVIDEDTKIIPGHGKLSNKTEYETFLKMLESIKINVLAEIEKGKTEEEVASNTDVTKVYDALNYGTGYINSEKVRRTFYKSLKK